MDSSIITKYLPLEIYQYIFHISYDTACIHLHPKMKIGKFNVYLW